jgi:hypothetical protein
MPDAPPVPDAAPPDAACTGSGSVMVRVDYAAFTGCEWCGDAEYACSTGGGWANGQRSFADPTPPGSIVTKIDGSLQSGTNPLGIDVTVDVEGTDLATVNLSQSASCGVCATPGIFASMTYPSGWPGWRVGMANKVQITPATDSLCVQWIDLTIYWSCP